MTEKIITCDVCKGSGKISKSETTNYHNGDKDEWEEHCRNCGGTGRMVEETTIRKLTMKELKLKKR